MTVSKDAEGAIGGDRRPAARGKAPSGATKVRYFVLFMCFVGLTINYLDRANMSVALPFIDDELGLNLTNTEKGLILGAFFWAYDGMICLLYTSPSPRDS